MPLARATTTIASATTRPSGAASVSILKRFRTSSSASASVGIDVVYIELRRLGLVAREELLDALLERIAAAEEDPDLHGLVELMERLRRGLRERVALARRPVPARVVPRREHVDEDATTTDAATPTIEMRLGASRFTPHLHASTARAVTKSGRTTSVPSKTSRRESTMPHAKSFMCAHTETCAQTSCIIVPSRVTNSPMPRMKSTSMSSAVSTSARNWLFVSALIRRPSERYPAPTRKTPR